MINKILTFGEIMLRLSPPGFQRFTQARSFDVIYGGTEANVAVSLAKFGMDVEYLTRLPENELGDACLNYLRQFGIKVDHVLRGGERLGKYFYEKGASVRSGKIIYDRSNSAISTTTNEMFDWDSILEGVSWFHWTGITPGLSENLANVCLEGLKKTKEKDITVSCDLNFRNKLWNYGKTPKEIMPELIEKCDVLIGSEFNIKKMLGISLSDGKLSTEANQVEKNRKIMEKLIKKYPNIAKVAFTIRNSLTASHNTLTGLLYDGREIYSSPTYDIDFIVDRVGAGDAFDAGLIYELIHDNEGLQRVVNFATAAAALKHTIAGDFNLVSKQEVEKVMEGQSLGIISR